MVRRSQKLNRKRKKRKSKKIVTFNEVYSNFSLENLQISPIENDRKVHLLR
jgi:hypothetical protein